MMNDSPELLHVRVVILKKLSMYALVELTTTTEGRARVMRFDPRQMPPVSIGPLEELPKVIEAFVVAIMRSKRNGWRVVYDGQPLLDSSDR
jgi:hypothetical protein